MTIPTLSELGRAGPAAAGPGQSKGKGRKGRGEREPSIFVSADSLNVTLRTFSGTAEGRRKRRKRTDQAELTG